MIEIKPVLVESPVIQAKIAEVINRHEVEIAEVIAAEFESQISGPQFKAHLRGCVNSYLNRAISGCREHARDALGDKMAVQMVDYFKNVLIQKFDRDEKVESK